MTARDETLQEVSGGQERAAASETGTAAATMPPTAQWLGGLGVVPFVLLAAVSLVADGPVSAHSALALAAYGAVILSFLGGVHWGVAIAGFGPDIGVCRISRRLAYSVLPSLIGWGALFLARPLGLMVLAAAFAGMLAFDLRAGRSGELPAWYPKLRLPLTLAVVASLGVGALA